MEMPLCLPHPPQKDQVPYFFFFFFYILSQCSSQSTLLVKTHNQAACSGYGASKEVARNQLHHSLFASDLHFCYTNMVPFAHSAPQIRSNNFTQKYWNVTDRGRTINLHAHLLIHPQAPHKNHHSRTSSNSRLAKCTVGGCKFALTGGHPDYLAAPRTAPVSSSTDGMEG